MAEVSMIRLVDLPDPDRDPELYKKVVNAIDNGEYGSSAVGIEPARRVMQRLFRITDGGPDVHPANTHCE